MLKAVDEYVTLCMLSGDVKGAIAQALADMREECAKVADKALSVPNDIRAIEIK